MDCEYDLYGLLPDRSIKWRSCVRGTRRAVEALQEMAEQTENGCFATEQMTDEIIARVNEGPQILDDDGSSAN